MFHQIGTYRALLSVPYGLRSSVYWNQQSLIINVKTNFQAEIDSLQLRMIQLESVVENLTSIVAGKFQ